jgi:hypothetical protein
MDELARHVVKSSEENFQLLPHQGFSGHRRSGKWEHQSVVPPQTRLSQSELPTAESTTASRHNNSTRCFPERRVNDVLYRFSQEPTKQRVLFTRCARLTWHMYGIVIESNLIGRYIRHMQTHALMKSALNTGKTLIHNSRACTCLMEPDFGASNLGSCR